MDSNFDAHVTKRFLVFFRFLKGVVSKDSLRSEATNPKKKGNLDFNDVVSKYVMKKYHKISENKGNPTVGLAARILDIAPFVVVVEEYVNGNNNGPGEYEFKPLFYRLSYQQYLIKIRYVFLR